MIESINQQLGLIKEINSKIRQAGLIYLSSGNGIGDDENINNLFIQMDEATERLERIVDKTKYSLYAKEIICNNKKLRESYFNRVIKKKNKDLIKDEKNLEINFMNREGILLYGDFFIIRGR